MRERVTKYKAQCNIKTMHLREIEKKTIFFGRQCRPEKNAHENRLIEYTHQIISVCLCECIFLFSLNFSVVFH